MDARDGKIPKNRNFRNWRTALRKSNIPVALPLVFITIALSFLSGTALGQEELASAIRRYKGREASSGFYDEYEVLPRGQTPLIQIPGVRQGLFPFSPSARRQATIRARLPDAHIGLKFYQNLQCKDCHPREARDAIHSVRSNLSCRQCHGGEPIASIDHYHSILNPIRRHAYVCAKCHEGAGASFASYVIHEPNPAMLTTVENFPILFYVFWFMIAVAGGTFAVFLPHTVCWGIRELFMKKGNDGERKEKKQD